MPSEVIHIRFPPDVDGSRELARAAADIAFDFSVSFKARQSGPADGCGYQRAGHIWTAWWTKNRAVVVRCERKVEAPCKP